MNGFGRDSFSQRHLLIFGLVASLIIVSQCEAAFFQRSGAKSQPPVGPVPAGKSLRANADSNVKELTFSGRFHVVTGSQQGVLILKAAIPKGSYIYSLTQKDNPPPSKITAESSNQIRIKGEFIADRHPYVIENDPVFGGRVEKHMEVVQFFVPIELRGSVNPREIRTEIVFNGQICSDKGTCMPIRNRRIEARFAGFFEQQAKKQAGSQNQSR